LEARIWEAEFIQKGGKFYRRPMRTRIGNKCWIMMLGVVVKLQFKQQGDD